MVAGRCRDDFAVDAEGCHLACSPADLEGAGELKVLGFEEERRACFSADLPRREQGCLVDMAADPPACLHRPGGSLKNDADHGVSPSGSCSGSDCPFIRTALSE